MLLPKFTPVTVKSVPPCPAGGLIPLAVISGVDTYKYEIESTAATPTAVAVTGQLNEPLIVCPGFGALTMIWVVDVCAVFTLASTPQKYTFVCPTTRFTPLIVATDPIPPPNGVTLLS
jgi:hypothetical protein